MNKTELVDLLLRVMPSIKEGAVPPQFKPPYYTFWENEWDFGLASDSVYMDLVTYQISIFADRPRHPKLLELLRELQKAHIYPSVRHEYVDDFKCFHSAFTIQIDENILDDET